MLSADAVLRGKNSTHSDIKSVVGRDNGINRPVLARDPEPGAGGLRESGSGQHVAADRDPGPGHPFRDAATGEYVVTSSRYGLYLYRIYRVPLRLETWGGDGDKAASSPAGEYDNAGRIPETGH